MKLIRRSEQHHTLSSPRPAIPRDHYYFYEKNTGVTHFHVEAGPDGCFPVDQAAGLLAMHCMVRGQIAKRLRGDGQRRKMIFLEGLTEKAEKLLQAGHSVGSPVKLTRREEEVLGGVMKSLANKEIAATLNLSERTVKFHVSSLLAKFRVRGRMELGTRSFAQHDGCDANANARRDERSADVCTGAAELWRGTHAALPWFHWQNGK